MNFIDNVVLQRRTSPVIVLPRETGIHYLGGTVDTLRLEPGCWIRVLLLIIQSVEVQTVWLHPFYNRMMIASNILLQRQGSFPRCLDMYIYPLG